MKRVTKRIIPVFALLLALPALTLPQGRWNDRDWDRNPGYGRMDSKDNAYHAGYNEGYREGVRQARHDSHEGRRFYNRDREIDHFGYGHNSRYDKDFQKGYKKGYKEGYREAYRRGNRDRW
jgi:flagellar biosynthesis/type III secretory pathway protein FliH